jgi:hypothetical protein
MSKDFDVVTNGGSTFVPMCCGTPATCPNTRRCERRTAFRADAMFGLQEKIITAQAKINAATHGSNPIDPLAGLADHFHPQAQLTTNSAARKEAPVYSGVMRYFPKALAAVARLSKIGNDKHNPGEPLHWSREKSSDHGDCIARHQLEAGTIDTDGRLHDEKVAWRALAQLEVAIEKLHAEGIDY